MPLGQRVVSLLPAATEMVAALGAWNRLVGVSHECDTPAAARLLPAVTGCRVADGTSADIDAAVRALHTSGSELFVLDGGRLRSLAPTLIVTQGLCEVCAVSDSDVRALAAELPTPATVLSLHARRWRDVLESIVAVANALDLPNEGEELVAGLQVRLRRVHLTLKAAQAPRPRVAVIEWTDPVYAAGHWVPEQVAFAGGTDALALAGEHSRRLEPWHVRDSSPDLLVFAPCGFGLHRACAEAAEIVKRPDWRWAAAIPAWSIDGNALTSRPGPRLCDGVETLARIMHPSLFGPPHPARARLVGS